MRFGQHVKLTVPAARVQHVLRKSFDHIRCDYPISYLGRELKMNRMENDLSILHHAEHTRSLGSNIVDLLSLTVGLVEAVGKGVSIRYIFPKQNCLKRGVRHKNPQINSICRPLLL